MTHSTCNASLRTFFPSINRNHVCCCLWIVSRDKDEEVEDNCDGLTRYDRLLREVVDSDILHY